MYMLNRSRRKQIRINKGLESEWVEKTTILTQLVDAKKRIIRVVLSLLKDHPLQASALLSQISQEGD